MPWNEVAPDISIVIPVYRAVDRLDASLALLTKFVRTATVGVQIIFVDDASDDGTGEQLFLFAAEHDAVMLITHEKNLGKGRSVADGVAAACGKIVVFTDIDMPYDLSAIIFMYEKFLADKRVHMLVGSRHHDDSVLEKPYTFVRRFSSWTFKNVARILVGTKFSDAQCGIKGFRLDAARLLFSDLIVSRFAFDVELFLRAKKFNLLYEEIPVIFRHEPHSTVKLVPASIQMFRDLVRLHRVYGNKNST